MFDDLEKVIAAEMPDFVAVKPAPRPKPAVDQKAGQPLTAPQPASSAVPDSPPSPAYQPDAAVDFFGKGDPRKRLGKSRNPAPARRHPPSGVIAVTNPSLQDSAHPAPIHRVIVRGGKIVGEQG